MELNTNGTSDLPGIRRIAMEGQQTIVELSPDVDRAAIDVHFRRPGEVAITPVEDAGQRYWRTLEFWR